MPLRIIKSADQQASIFLHQKLKVGSSSALPFLFPFPLPSLLSAFLPPTSTSIRGEMMMHRFGNWAVQCCLEAATSPEERRKIVACMRGRIVDFATNCYGYHVLQKVLDCEDEEDFWLIVSELLRGDPATTLVNKHASHVWSKAALACHETGLLVVHNLEESAKDGIVDELLGQGAAVFNERILEHGLEKHRQMALEHLLTGLLGFATSEQGSKSVVKTLKEGGKETLDRVVQRMYEPAKGARRPIIMDLALSLTES
ncbi:armadillo-type protein [Mycena rebaudengoi]|nr:armadillo-type protein [Mycena rebaudengoi]